MVYKRGNKNKLNQTEVGLIPEEWKVKSLKDVADVLTGFPFKGEDYSLNDGILVVRGENLSDRKFKWDIPKRWRFFNDSIKKYLLKDNLAVVSMDGNVGVNKAITKENDLPLLLAQRVAAIIAKNGECQDFINQVIMSPRFLKYCNQIKTGTTISHISKGQIESFIIPYPNNIKEQKAIAKILSDLDSKIELNEKMNKTLEGIAQAIFKHWFIDFEFPNEEGKPYKSSGGEMVDSELGMIPSNWTIKKLDDIANFLNGLPLQKYPAISGERYFPVIKIKEMNSGISTSSDKASCDIPPEYIVANGDILFAWSGSLGVTIWCNGMGALNQHLFKVSSTEYPKWFYYQWLLHYLPDFIEIAKYKATTMGHIQRQHLSKSLVAVPDSNTFKMMNTIFNPIINRIINLRVEKDVLAKTRDIILPKLMTGKIRVSLEDKNDKQNE